jgi:hypothetical protein
MPMPIQNFGCITKGKIHITGRHIVWLIYKVPHNDTFQEEVVMRYFQVYFFVLLVLLSSPMAAQTDKTHPITGELLAQKQVFTYNSGNEPVEQWRKPFL